MVDLPHSSRAALLAVSRVIEETPDSRSLVFDVPAGLRETFEYRPGQFLTLRIPSTVTGSVARCYSLASSPHCDDEPKITVKRTAGGYGSNWLCDNVSAGDSIEVLRPSGVFTPAHFDHDFLLWAAGSGITPVISILKSVLAAGKGHVVLIYANRDERSVIFAEELAHLATCHPGRLSVMHWLVSVQGIPDVAQFAALAAHFGDRESFMCGPGRFMEIVHAALATAGVARSRIHAEVFTSLAGDPFMAEATEQESSPATAADDGADVEVELDGKVHMLRWPRKRNLVDTMLSAGIDVPHSCREGHCGSCAATVLEGEVEMVQCDILQPEDVEAGLVLTCQARPVSDVVRIQF